MVMLYICCRLLNLNVMPSDSSDQLNPALRLTVQLVISIVTSLYLAGLAGHRDTPMPYRLSALDNRDMRRQKGALSMYTGVPE